MRRVKSDLYKFQNLMFKYVFDLTNVPVRSEIDSIGRGLETMFNDSMFKGIMFRVRKS